MKEPANKLSAASYTRLAHANPEQEAEQHAANVAVAARIGASIPETFDFRYCDVGTSGRASERQDMERLKAAVAAGSPFQIIIAQDAARLARDPKLRDEELRWFRARGVRWVFSSDAPRDPVGVDDIRRAVSDHGLLAEVVAQYHQQALANFRRAARAAKRKRAAVCANSNEQTE